MVFTKKYLSIDVLTAARQRFDRIMDEFDGAVVSFSGGKDSLVCLHLLKEAHERHGRPFPVRAMFFDEELLPDSVVNFVDGYRHEPWLELLWFAYPFTSNKYRLGRTEVYIQWDADRPHVRPMPRWAIRPPAGQRGPFSQYDMHGELARRYPGRIACVVGIRADESFNRFCSVAGRGVDNWMSPSHCPAVVVCKPIYDWSESDVFKFLGERNIAPCPLYDAQLYDRTPLRVSTPLHTGSARRLSAWRRLDPDFHQRVTAVFPEMLAQDRYAEDFAPARENSLEAMQAWASENIHGARLDQIVNWLGMVRRQIGKGHDTSEHWKEWWKALETGQWLRGVPTMTTRADRKARKEARAKHG